jgi:hypothetical protein
LYIQCQESRWKATRDACTYIVRRLIRRLLGDAHATEITRRISGMLENRHHMFIVRRVSGMLFVEAHTMFIVMRVGGRLEDWHVHCQESKWKARRQACSLSGE